MASSFDQPLQGKIALITGSNRGIGRAILDVFARSGAVVYANARKPHVLDAVAAHWSERCGAEVQPLYFDVTDNVGMRDAFARIQHERGRLDILVNNAGIMRDALIGMITNELISDLFSVNVYAVINAIQYAAKLMTRQKSGSIINLSSVVGVQGHVGQMAYSASKGAVIALTKTAAKELAPKGIRVNAIAPGLIDTEMLRSIGESRLETLSGQIAMGRLGHPQDVASAALFLASDGSEYITGQVLGVDGSVLM